MSNNFLKIFKAPYGTQEVVKKMEKMVFKYRGEETTEEKDLEYTTVFHYDEDREIQFVKNLFLFDKLKKGKKTDDGESIFCFNYKPGRDLDLFKIYDYISRLYTIDESSCPILHQVFLSKNMDLFFNLIIKNDYDYSMKVNGPKTVITKKGGEFGV